MDGRDNNDAKTFSALEMDSNLNLMKEVFNDISPRTSYVEQESTRVADMLNHAGDFASAGPEMIRPAAVELSSALRHLNKEESNELLLKIQDKQRSYSGDMQFCGRLQLGNWDDAKSTWNNVVLSGRQAGYPMTPEIRIVQPGNTLWNMANERLAEPIEGKTLAFDSNDVREMIQETASQNGIEDPRKIEVGDAIILPMWSKDGVWRK